MKKVQIQIKLSHEGGSKRSFDKKISILSNLLLNSFKKAGLSWANGFLLQLAPENELESKATCEVNTESNQQSLNFNSSFELDSLLITLHNLYENARESSAQTANIQKAILESMLINGEKIEPQNLPKQQVEKCERKPNASDNSVKIDLSSGRIKKANGTFITLNPKLQDVLKEMVDLLASSLGNFDIVHYENSRSATPKSTFTIQSSNELVTLLIERLESVLSKLKYLDQDWFADKASRKSNA